MTPESSGAETPPQIVSATGAGRGGGPLTAAVRIWLAAYRIELVLFLISFAVLAAFSSQRFLRQSEAPHFVYQAKGWLEGRIDLDPQVLPNLEDWACVREVSGVKVRCENRAAPGDRWYVSFPSFPAVVMLPFVAVNSYQFNDTSFGVLVGALAVALFYSLLRHLTQAGETDRTRNENMLLALVLAFGTLFFYCAIRGEVWFSAEVMGVALTCLYAKSSVRASRPMLAGLYYSMAVLTRTPLVFSGLFFVLECLCPGPESRLSQLKKLSAGFRAPLRKLLLFGLGAAPLAVAGAVYNFVRFGRFSEFGHRFLVHNRVNSDIDRFGLFSLEYFGRNVEAALFKLPHLSLDTLRLSYDPNGLSLLLTLPLFWMLLLPDSKQVQKSRWLLLALPVVALIGYQVFPRPVGLAPSFWPILWLAVLTPALVLPLLHQQLPRLYWPLFSTVAVCALPGLFYQNNGYMQFGFRFSLDYTPYLLLLVAVSRWRLWHPAVMASTALAVVVNFWGAVGFRGYTELMRNW